MGAVVERDNVQEIVTAGEEIYARKFQSDYESRFPGQFAVIDIDSQQAVVGQFPEDAVLLARQRFGTAPQHLIQIGSPAAVQLGFFLPHAGVAWAI